MGWGIGLGRGWLRGRYAFSPFTVWLQGRRRRRSTKERKKAYGKEERKKSSSRGIHDRTIELLYLTAIFSSHRFSANRPRPQTPLDSIKFVCKDLWPLLFRKQIDNLKTNHRGVFVLTDTRFQPLSRVSVDRKAGVKAPEETLSRAQAVSFHWHPCFCLGDGSFFGREIGWDVVLLTDVI
jgi:hypothetical protein